MSDEYLMRVKGARWAVSRPINGVWIALIQNTPVDDPGDVRTVLRALGIPLRKKNIRYYFPSRRGRRCPRLELLELFAALPPGTGRETGV